jgi:NAD(P)-dependent dehydrogenase (short-subunit alcohol dehydrogenase family)
MTDLDEFSGRSALITGGTHGGKGIADRLRAGGARVVVAARSGPEGPAADDVIAADVSTADGVAELAAEALRRLGAVDILVHNVGGSGQYEGGAASLIDEDWQTALDANLLAAVRLDRAIIPGMVERGSGAIVHITSIQRRAPLPTSIPYAAAKAALTNYSKALSNESPKGTGVNPSAPDTSKRVRLPDGGGDRRDNNISINEARAQIMESIADPPGAPPAGSPDVGELVAFLVSDRAAYINGSEYVIDGGSVRGV